LTLDGDAITDPALHGGMVYKKFNGPLFSSQGPKFTDTVQGSLGDCYLLVGLGAIAYDQPQVLKANIVDFNDGTYGVRFGNEFFRVDGDLPASSSYATTPAFAQLGSGGSLWVAIAEKAFAHYRTTAESYKAIEYGWHSEVFHAFNALEVGKRSFSVFSSGVQIANQLYTHWSYYQAACVGFIGSATNNYGLVMNHAYLVHSFQWNSTGAIASVTFRNPWGFDGSNRDSNPNDGLVTLTTDELFALRGNGWMEFGRFV
ncbi:MAG: C2 family cysteine protease, partial [Planctomycetota bacterium]